MPGPLDLTNDRISFTYDRLVQTDGAGNFFNGLGDPITFGPSGSSGSSGSSGDSGSSGSSGDSGSSGSSGSSGTSGSSGINEYSEFYLMLMGG